MTGRIIQDQSLSAYQGRQSAPRPTAERLHIKAILLALLTLGWLGLVVMPLHSAGTRNEYQTTVSTPTFSLPGGSYDRGADLAIVPPYTDAPILFTNDGSLPTWETGTLYTGAIPLSTVAPGIIVIRARAVLEDGTLGPVISASYAMGLETTLPIASLIIDPQDLWDETTGIYENPLGRGLTSERPAHLTFIDSDHESGFETGVGVRVHGYQSRAYAKKSLRVYFRSEYGVPRLNYPVFQDYDVTSFNALVLHSGGQDYAHPPLTNWTLIRNQLAAELAFELGVMATHSRAALLFINGEPWGITQIRERIDEDFLAESYGIPSADVLEAPESALREVMTGDRDAWDSLMATLDTQDLSDPDIYAAIGTQIDIEDFIRYHILQIYSANTDWPAHNIHLVRPRTPGGQWRWLVWDSDNGFGAEGYSQVHSDMISHLLDYRHPETDGRDTLLFRKLLDNSEYRLEFLSTLADLLNTTLSPASVIDQIDALAAELAPDISYETLRWPGTTSWGENIQQLRDFATERPAYVRQHVVERFGLPGTMDLTVQPPSTGEGFVAINGQILEVSPWQGTYFQDLPVTLTAIPAPGYAFAGWENHELAQEQELRLSEGDTWTVTPRFEKASRWAVTAGDLTITAVHVEEDTNDEGDWFDLRVNRIGGLDLRGWRITDNDTKTAIDEGSLIFANRPELERVPFGTTIHIKGAASNANAELNQEEDVDTRDLAMVLQVGGDYIDDHTDPWFNLGPHDNLVVLAPGETAAFDDDIGIDFWGPHSPVTAATFGILVDGVIGGY